MGKLAVYKYLLFMVLVITLLTAVFTLFAIFGGDANPTINTALAMLVVTIVVTNAGLSGIVPVALRSCKMYSPISIPDMFPVKGTYSPVLRSFA